MISDNYTDTGITSFDIIWKFSTILSKNTR